VISVTALEKLASFSLPNALSVRDPAIAQCATAISSASFVEARALYEYRFVLQQINSILARAAVRLLLRFIPIL
jgi:hypothetical protein